jgi:hypothetical protein
MSTVHHQDYLNTVHTQQVFVILVLLASASRRTDNAIGRTMTPSGIEPTTFRFVTQYLNHCATAVPQSTKYASVLETGFPLHNGLNCKRLSRSYSYSVGPVIYSSSGYRNTHVFKINKLINIFK